MFYSDDPIADFERHDAYKEKCLRRLPVCCCCYEHIQQETAIKIDGEFYCDDCLEDFRVDITE